MQLFVVLEHSAFFLVVVTNRYMATGTAPLRDELVIPQILMFRQTNQVFLIVVDAVDKDNHVVIYLAGVYV